MTRDEIVTALRQCPRYGVDCSKGVCAFFKPNGAFEDCIKKKNDAAADLIENQQRHIEAQAKEIDALRNELCLKCGNYTLAHEGACNGCRWRREERT